jgi:hypothetical protein
MAHRSLLSVIPHLDRHPYGRKMKVLGHYIRVRRIKYQAPDDPSIRMMEMVDEAHIRQLVQRLIEDGLTTTDRADRVLTACFKGPYIEESVDQQKAAKKQKKHLRYMADLETLHNMLMDMLHL